MPRPRKSETPKEKNSKNETTLARENGKTSAQQLSSVIKSARDIMRKDRGLSGDTDRLPQLTWLLFLKFIDDNERLREVEAELGGEKFKPAIQAPYRWRDWASPPDGMTGDDLKNFINNDEATLPDGKRGKGEPRQVLLLDGSFHGAFRSNM